MPQLERTLQGKMGLNSDIFQVTDSVTTDAAINTNYDGNKQDNIGASGAMIVVKLGTKVGTVGLTPRILSYDEDGNAIILKSLTELTAAGTYTYLIHPGTISGMDGSGITAVVAGILPRAWNIRLSKTTGDSDQNFPAEVLASYLK